MNKKTDKDERHDDRRDRPTLDSCYGKIGISAVAGALSHKQEEPPQPREPRFPINDRD
jgi:hypothetical protein